MTKKIFVLAGEASGDLLGGKLLSAIQSKAQVEFVGVGGDTMTAAGLKSLFPMTELSHMGIFEVIRHLPQILRRLNQLTEYILETKPDLVITIDLPDFSFRLAKKLRGSGIPHVHYTAPTVWAWRPGRAKKVAQLVDHLLCILPFEPPYFTPYGLPCTFVGHMVTELGIENIPREQFRQTHNLGLKDKLLCLLPGSRRGEVERLLPVFKETIRLLPPDLKVVVPVVPAVRDLIEHELDDVIFVDTPDQRYAAMRAADVALAASGTVNLELSMAGTPYVIAYKMNPLTAWLAPKLVNVKYMTMTNILLDQPAIPEFFQNDVTPENLAKALTAFLNDNVQRDRILKQEDAAIALLRTPAGYPSLIAAQTALSLMDKKAPSTINSVVRKNSIS